MNGLRSCSQLALVGRAGVHRPVVVILLDWPFCVRLGLLCGTGLWGQAAVSPRSGGTPRELSLEASGRAAPGKRRLSSHLGPTGQSAASSRIP